MMRRLVLLLAVALGGCAYYVGPDGVAYPVGAYPYTVPGAPASFDRSFSAVSGALLDTGFNITTEDRSTGLVVGKLGAGTVSGRVLRQADGSVRVTFDSSGMSDPSAIERVSQAYERRMGR